MEYIKSRNNPYIKDICKLTQKKHRLQSGRFIFEGKKLFEEALACGVEFEIAIFNENMAEYYSTKSYVFETICVTNEIYEKISEEKSPEGVFCVAKAIDKLHKKDIIYNGDMNYKNIFILDGIRDPGNLGTILRSASAFAVDCLILSDDCVDVYNSKTIRASMGAVFRQKTFTVTDIVSTVEALIKNGYNVYSAVLDKNSVFVKNIKMVGKIAFVIGNEANGVRNEIIEAGVGCVQIPMNAGTESLNASIAASILMWENYNSNF